LSVIRKAFRRPIDISTLLDQTDVKLVDGNKVAVKHYTKPSGLIKWLILNFPPIPFYYPLTLDPEERMKREIAFFNSEIVGVFRPKIYKINWEKIFMEREYIEGREISLESIEDIEALGRTISKIHSASFCLGDTKPENFIVSNEKVYVIDAEQSLERCPKKKYIGWDIMLTALFIFWSNPLATPQEYSSKFSTFLQGYRDEGGDLSWEILKEAHPLILLIPPRLVMIIKSLVE
jgi:tRNA A-37 threonylcarbamoyl transferase component Bud32